MPYCTRFIVFSAILLLTAQAFPQRSKDIRIDDDSDWWSIIRENASEQTLKPEEKDVEESHFKILGVTVGKDELAQIVKSLGDTAVFSRGDAGTGRSQICYVAEDGRTHLIFETGEVQYAFYLFNEGPDWSGRDQCKRSKLVTNDSGTVSGLHLGQSPTQVKVTLGRPTASGKNGDLIYFRQIKKNTSEEDLQRLRQHYSNLGDREFHESFDFYYLTAYIVARFSDSKLVYLGVSKSEVD